MGSPKLNFIVTGLQSWYLNIGSNAKNIALELSNRHQVIYVNLPLKRRLLFRPTDPGLQRIKSIRKGERDQYTQINDNFWVYDPACIVESINHLPKGYLFNALNKLNNRRFANEIRQAAKKLGFDKFYLINDTCMFEGLHLKELLNPVKYVYYFRDDLTYQDYFKKHGVYCQNEIFKKADLVAANSTFLRDLAADQGANAAYVGQGVEIDKFNINDKVTKPEFFNKTSGKVVGYIGSLNAMRLDIDLMIGIAKDLPEYSIVLVGPEDIAFEKSALHKLPNVYFVGLKPMSELKNYLAFFDVCINPQLVNELTIGNYPIKIDEYLALGKPVVATKTKAMEMFASHTYLATGREEYVQQIKRAISEDSKAKTAERVNIATSHSWKNSVDALLDHLL